MRSIFVVLVVGASTFYLNDVTNYLQEYRKTGVSDYSLEQDIIKSNDLDKLVKELTPFYSDTLTRVRQKAYYLTYKKAVLSDNNRTIAINALLRGCSDKDGGIIGQNLGFLKGFHLKDFNEESAQLIKLKLANHRIQHYKEFVLLAGFIGVGKDILYQKLLDQSVSPKSKWYISLALARTGNAEQINYCMERVQKLPLNDNLVDYVIPDLIYIRQKETIDYCIKVLNDNEKLCHSLNPDISESIICGYRVLELLAPVIVGIPVPLDPSGFISSNNLEPLLNDTRKWFSENPNYQILKNTY